MKKTCEKKCDERSATLGKKKRCGNESYDATAETPKSKCGSRDCFESPKNTRYVEEKSKTMQLRSSQIAVQDALPEKSHFSC